MENNLSSALKDFASYEIHDGIKMRKLPIDQAMLMENGFVSFGYNMITKTPLKALKRWVPQTADEYGDELLKFGGETVGFITYRMLMGKPYSFGEIMLKQLLTQGGQYMLNQI